MNKLKNTNLFYGLFGILISFVLITIDQYTKRLAILYLKENPIILIKNIFQLTYLENRGAAFGIMQGKKMFFVIITIVILSFIFFIYLRVPKSRHYNLLRFVMILFVSGAIGNMIDRVSYNYVVDFFYFELINFPIFNVADCYVTIAAGLLIFLFLFVYKEEELNSIFQLGKKGLKKENE
ncbi:signal peptidase II [Anaerosacchariphilus polymeriproducens]|uniref:Lipoprotein signal peptidase n=1 Tax=Anaerosacchariphilus polymeriproducens TaxID=1812858 RepID=A0A371AU71_9FIRM|nr:signal peptidase II [Anaerosacchariphilus polymeriproducens]RDU23050.1 signal peptidase II [Anaerosacchariphilus polymeriproducens]